MNPLAEKSCAVCGSRPAPFGFGVSIVRANKFFKKGQPQVAQKFLGRWYCDEHKGAEDGTGT